MIRLAEPHRRVSPSVRRSKSVARARSSRRNVPATPPALWVGVSAGCGALCGGILTSVVFWEAVAGMSPWLAGKLLVVGAIAFGILGGFTGLAAGCWSRYLPARWMKVAISVGIGALAYGYVFRRSGFPAGLFWAGIGAANGLVTALIIGSRSWSGGRPSALTAVSRKVLRHAVTRLGLNAVSPPVARRRRIRIAGPDASFGCKAAVAASNRTA